jgi:hypothetical protein
MEEPKPQEEIKVERGELVMYQIFDCAEEINLERAEKVLQEKRSKARLEQIPPDDMVFPNPPLCYLLGTHTISASRLEYTATLEAHIFHTGNISISAWLPIPNGMPMRELLHFSLELEDAKSLFDLMKKEAARLIKILSAITETRDGYREEYSIFVLTQLSRPCETDEDRELLAGLLLREKGNRKLSRATINEVFGGALSYYQDDLVMIDWNSAVIVDPDEGPVPAILELATVQLLELRYYDMTIDKKLASIYDILKKQKGLHANLFWGSQGELLRSLLLRALELAEHADRIENSLTLMGDSYFARVYNLAAQRFELSRYISILSQKSATIRDVASMVNAETETARSLLLEILVVLLIVTEVIMGLVGH